MTESKEIEILKMAILMEHRGKAFYKKVAEQTSIDDVKKIFEIMADEEQSHIEFLTSQFAYFSKNLEFNSDKLNLNNADEKISKLVLSPDLKKKISAAGFEASAISAAIDMEKKAVEVYSQRAKETTDKAEKELYEWLANWENSHLGILAKLDRELTEQIWFDNNFWPF